MEKVRPCIPSSPIRAIQNAVMGIIVSSSAPGHAFPIPTTYLLRIEVLCLSCFLARYKSFFISVRNSNKNSITNSDSMTMNRMKPKEPVVCHQWSGDSNITLYTSGVEVAHRIGRNQLRPMLPEIPVARVLVAAVSLRGPSSVVTRTVIATRVDEPSRRNAVSRAIITLYQSWKDFERERGKSVALRMCV